MRPRRTPRSNSVFRLDGGNEDNDLWVEAKSGPPATLVTTWELTDEERRAVADGANIELTIFGDAHPPTAMRVTRQRLGRAPSYA